ncbi:hypothetical protein [Shewanella algae]|uniref:hypothetical protein n=1 Tax=Shewanella algae TaxID=38313 RepID=UPI001AADBA38|nr:hypothetical protein [Shewanella algae]QTE85421.1 hypothetical protein JKK44_15200 [Shewanella algae]
MKHNPNQYQIQPDSLAQEAVESFKCSSGGVPKIIPLKLGDGDKSIMDVVASKTEGNYDADVYLFVVPGEPGRPVSFPAAKQIDSLLEGLDNLPPTPKEKGRAVALKMKYLRDRGHSYKQIAEILGYPAKNHATVLVTLKRHGLWKPTYPSRSKKKKAG